MPDHDFQLLRTRLLESGVAPRHVKRIVAELDDHLEDLRVEAINQGRSVAEAQAWAAQRIGSETTLADRILAIPEYRAWIYRYPRVARIYLPLAYALLLPAAPVFAGIANPGIVFRWGAALMLSAAVTAAMFLSMQLAIVLT